MLLPSEVHSHHVDRFSMGARRGAFVLYNSLFLALSLIFVLQAYASMADVIETKSNGIAKAGLVTGGFYPLVRHFHVHFYGNSHS